MSSHNDPVEPIPFDVAQPAPSLTPTDTRATGTGLQGSRPAWVLPALGGLVLLAVLVIVWLPKSLEPTPIEAAQPTAESANSATAGQTNTAAPKASPGNADAAPWSDAQAAHLRKTAQEVAAQLLELQLALQERGIEQWAPTQFAEVVTLASSGDTLYRDRQYEEATAQYQQGLTTLQALQEAIPQKLEQLLEQAQQAIEQGDAATAQTALTTAAILSPDDSDIAALQKRAEVLPQLMSLLEQAATAEAAGDLSQAQQLLQEAATLDPQHQRAQSELERVATAAREQGFNKAMSEGYAALDEGRYDSARKSFRAAAKLQQGSTEAASALQEVAAAESAQRLVTLDKRGRSYEQQEQWQKAVKSFEQAQKLDSSVLFAREGLKRSRARAQLDTQLRKVIEEPGRLSDAAVATGAAQLLEQAGQITAPGPLLAQQIKQLDRLLIQADSPVAVTLRSDQETEVIVYKVARLGHFSEKELSLRPGTYTAVGTRDGYRDVRHSFTLAHNTTPAPVTIICTEPI
jgi:tetratricopeptide (TPR) repeat protein